MINFLYQVQLSLKESFYLYAVFLRQHPVIYNRSGIHIADRPQIIQDIKKANPLLFDTDLDYLQFTWKRELVKDWHTLNHWNWPENIPYPERGESVRPWSGNTRRSQLMNAIDSLLDGELNLGLAYSIDDEENKSDWYKRRINAN